MFKRPHHRSVAQVLYALNGSLLRDNCCLFGGGTAIALRYGEYRESVDVDLLVSDVESYRNLRQLLTGDQGITAILHEHAVPLVQAREIRADQYGIRTMLQMVDRPIKFEIVLEGRIGLDMPDPSYDLCGIPTLTPLDMAATKLLANSDRWADDGVFSRDLIDLAMMEPTSDLLRRAIEKAEQAYGKSIREDLDKAINRMKMRHDWLERCMQMLTMELPRALVWQRIRGLSFKS